ncbi:hypothetical protein V1525DRAFT_428543 [Lipomyces kononenkoae]|uniref:Uncharacterized protein n=1 Tax=Lipomyces kononenkoae TaxID=34357 RepID=A0ACC3SRT0_LIPKO
MDAIVTGSSINFRQSVSRARSTTTRNSPSRASDLGMSLSKAEKAVSDFDKALDLLKNNPAEQRLDVHMSYSRYLELEECWPKIKAARNISSKYPSLSYNSVAETVTVITIPRDLHEVGAADLVNSIIGNANIFLASHGADASLIRRIKDARASDRKGRGDYARSKKMADSVIVFAAGTVEGVKTMIAIEVGFTENYNALCEDKDFWILGQHVDVCIFVCLEESPRFRNPRTPFESVADVDAEVATMMQNVAADFDRDSARGHYGSIEYRGHKLVGELREAFIEVWRVNRRRPRRYVYMIQDSLSLKAPPKSFGLRIRDLVPQNYLADWHIPDGDIVFDGDEYLVSLRQFMAETARQRYFGFISP